MKKKTKYRIRNWSDYNRSLRNRGSLTFWISQELIDNWNEAEQTGERLNKQLRRELKNRVFESLREVEEAVIKASAPT